MKYAIILLAIIASLNSINSERTSHKQVQVKKRFISDISNALSKITKGFYTKLEQYKHGILRSFKRPHSNTNRHICLWKICSKPLRSAVKSGQQNILKAYLKENSAYKKMQKEKRKKTIALIRSYLNGPII